MRQNSPKANLQQASKNPNDVALEQYMLGCRDLLMQSQRQGLREEEVRRHLMIEAQKAPPAHIYTNHRDVLLAQVEEYAEAILL